MKNYKMMFLLLCFFTPYLAEAQLQVITHYSSFNIFSKDNLNEINILNSSSLSVQADVEIRLISLPGNAVVVTGENSLSLQPGLNLLGMERFDYVFSQSAKGQEFSNSGILPGGKYRICIIVKSKNQNEIISNQCEEIVLDENKVLHLLSPVNNEEIETLNPILQWVSTYDAGTTYHLRVVPLAPYKTPEQALGENEAYLDIDLAELNSLYPFSSPILEYNLKYAWQVYALSGDHEIIAYSECWVFSPVRNERKQVVKKDCYRLIHKELNNGNYFFNGLIKFGYVNSSHQKTLSYSVYDVTDGKPCEDLPIIYLTGGLNKIDIDIRDISGMKKNHTYVLEIKNQYRESYQFSFLFDKKR